MNGSLKVKCYRTYFFVQILDAIPYVAYTFVKKINQSYSER